MRLFFFLVSFIFTHSLFSQESKPSYLLTPRIHYGYIWDFAEEVSHLSNQHLPAFEINVTKQTNGVKAWQQEFRYPQVGYSLSYYAFNKDKPVGNFFTLLIHAGKNIYKTKQSNVQWRLGFGGAYVERRFDTHTNFRNNVVSQRVNFTISGQLNFNMKLSQRIGFNLGVGLLHISNGSLKLPNFGINLPTIHTGFSYVLNKDESITKQDIKLPHVRKTFFHIAPFMGLKEVYPSNGPKYFLGGLTAFAERRMNRKSGLHAGVEFSYDHSKKSEIIRDTIPVKNIFLNRAQAAVLVGHELYINRLSLLTQVGIYTYDPTYINKAWYQKVGLKYYLSDKVFVNMSMKIHLGVADWIEWGMGMKL